VLASEAEAQSSVTLYGTLDEAAVYFNDTGHGSVVQMQGGDLNANRWGSTLISASNDRFRSARMSPQGRLLSSAQCGGKGHREWGDVGRSSATRSHLLLCFGRRLPNRLETVKLTAGARFRTVFFLAQQNLSAGTGQGCRPSFCAAHEA
jgi:hypothetical protein